MAFLYFKNTTTTGVWNDVTNWFTDAACTTQAANVPWVAGDSTYLGYDLTRSSDSVTAEDSIYINANIGDGLTITGTCDIGAAGAGLLTNNGGISIFGGTWSGGFFSNAGTIGGGTFSGNSFSNSGIIISGTFSGTAFYNTNTIYSGTFSGDDFSNSSGAYIFGGTFSGYITNQSGGYIYGGTFSGDSSNSNGTIYGGIFTGNGFYNYYVINNGVFSGDNFVNQSGGEIRGGIFTGNGFSDTGTIFGGFWLESGFLDIDIFDYTNGGPYPTITGQIRIEGVVTNPYPLDLSPQQGFMTLKIKGQDVLGGGLL